MNAGGIMQPSGDQRHRERFEVVSSSAGTSCRETVGGRRGKIGRRSLGATPGRPSVKGELSTNSGG
jgi:hypothetical protein